MVARKSTKKKAGKATKKSAKKVTKRAPSRSLSSAKRKTKKKTATKKKTSSKKTASKRKPTASSKSSAKSSAKSSSKNTAKVNARRSPSTTQAQVPAARRLAAVERSTPKRRNPRLIQKLLLMPPAELETYFERIGQEEVCRIFEDSYPSDLVNLLLGLKRSTCRRLFDIVTEQRKRAYLDTITMYYYKDYLTNPFPLELDSQAGSSMPNYYAIIGMARDATEDEMDMASRLLTRAFKPESFPPNDRKMGDLRSKEIQAAFERLKTPARREEVDRLLPSLHYYYPRRDQSWLDLVQRFSS